MVYLKNNFPAAAARRQNNAIPIQSHDFAYPTFAMFEHISNRGMFGTKTYATRRVDRYSGYTLPLSVINALPTSPATASSDSLLSFVIFFARFINSELVIISYCQLRALGPWRDYSFGAFNNFSSAAEEVAVFALLFFFSLDKTN